MRTLLLLGTQIDNQQGDRDRGTSFIERGVSCACSSLININTYSYVIWYMPFKSASNKSHDLTYV